MLNSTDSFSLKGCTLQVMQANSFGFKRIMKRDYCLGDHKLKRPQKTFLQGTELYGPGDKTILYNL